MNEFIRALREVPEERLRLIELAWELVGEDGNLDCGKAVFHSQELEEALAEAQAYVQAAKEALWELSRLARS